MPRNQQFTAEVNSCLHDYAPPIVGTGVLDGPSEKFALDGRIFPKIPPNWGHRAPNLEEDRPGGQSLQ